MACQLARPFIPHSSLIRSTGLQLGMPCLGQCLNLGASSKTKECRYCGSAGTYCSISIGTLRANCRKFMCARKARR